MTSLARLISPTGKVTFQPSARPNSNFDLIEKHFDGLDTLRRTLSQVRAHGGKTVVIESVVGATDVIEEDEDATQLDPSFIDSETCRLSFFKRAINSPRQLAKATDSDFIGYAIVKRDRFSSGFRSRILESVIRRPPHKHNYIKREQTWRVRVGSEEFKVAGYLYAQQSGLTNCCAHVAVRTASASFVEGGMSFREMNQRLGMGQNRPPKDGLEAHEMASLLESVGARCFVADYQQLAADEPRLPFQKYVYGSIESGYPAIIAFQTTTLPGVYHAIPMFGHTFNGDTWVPSAERSYFTVGSTTRYLPSESWVSMFIGHDDNWGSNYCIPRHYFQTHHPVGPTQNPGLITPQGECVAQVIATVPQDVQVSPIAAEIIGADYLMALRPHLAANTANTWSERLKYYADKDLLVLRPILIDIQTYASHLSRIRDWHNSPIRGDFVQILREFPNEKVWMIELSVPELFSTNLRKVGEVLVRAQTKLGPDRDFSGYFSARLPGCFALYADGGPSNPRFLLHPSGAESHVELFGCEEIAG